MTAGRQSLRATPFHARTAEANRDNAWNTRIGFTLATHYESAETEALAARANVGLADISWHWRVRLEGAAAEQFISRLVTRDAAALEPRAGFKALWLSDAGGVRGAGIIARLGKETFQLTAMAPDADWISAAAASFDVQMRDVSGETGGLAIVGRYAEAVLKAADLAIDIAPLSFRNLSWRGLEIVLSRWGDGYEIWCNPDDALLVWDRLMRAGADFGIAPAGTAAMDLLDLEAGMARPHLDFLPARDDNAAKPLPASLGLEAWVDPGHANFNGRQAMLAARLSDKLVGIEIDSDTPAPFAPLFLGGRPVGHTLRSAYSPALRRAIALARVDSAAATPGTKLSVSLPTSLARPEERIVGARIVALPLLATQRPAGG